MSLSLADIPDLPAELNHLLRQIPPGRVTTYGDLARALGDVSAARWVGEYLLQHLHDDTCTCHRVVRKGGDVGLYVTGNPRDKICRLQAEGVGCGGGRIERSAQYHAEFKCAAPLTQLRRLQEHLPQRIELCPLERNPRTIAGIDVSYLAPDDGIAAYVTIDALTHQVLWSTTVRGPVRFPYIPGYLTFRELPLLAKLFTAVRRARQEADVTLVDGNGILHPRRAGSAAAVGVAVETPTIGIGKKLLCGSVELRDLPPRQPRNVIHQQQCIGVSLKSGSRNRPFFASPGHRITLADTIAVVQQSLGNGRLPVPIALADRISREEVARLKAVAQP